MAGQEFIRGLNSLQPSHRGCVATIGSFDGVHLGHQKILESVKRKSKALGKPSVVVIFEPQPHEYFARKEAPPRLTRLREKVDALFAQGVDRVLCLRFDQPMRSLPAEAFVNRVLVDGLGLNHLVVGDDFRFGCDRRGDFTLLQEQGRVHGFSVQNTETYVAGGERVSSTRIRGLLAQNDFVQAAALLGRGYGVSGRVCYGNQLGRTIGVPTANIGLGRYRVAVTGVFAVRVTLGGELFQGVANVGIKPTVGTVRKPSLEVHFFDLDRDLYGEEITVLFEKKIRDEKSFGSFELLKQQIHADLDQAKAHFKSFDKHSG